jgi:hypothetical protein
MGYNPESTIQEGFLGRVIQLEGVGKERKQLSRAVVLALRELMKQTEPDHITRDLAAFIALALDGIYQTIDESVAAWEKRGYWLKADRFRLEWAWSETMSRDMRNAVLQEDWPKVALTAASIAQKLNAVVLPQRHGLGTPWVGAWERLKQKQA